MKFPLAGVLLVLAFRSTGRKLQSGQCIAVRQHSAYRRDLYYNPIHWIVKGGPRRIYCLFL
jgi:hypothetical protein